jgi:hypothetical protein
VTERLNTIQPPLLPSEYRMDFFPVFQDNTPVADLYILEIAVPKPRTIKGLYYTSSGEAWAKTDGGKRKLIGIDLEQEIIRRLNQLEKQ